MVLRQKRPTWLKCPFCQSGKKPDYKDVEVLKPFVSDWSKILPRSRTGICTKHQRLLAQSIKRARHLGLISFTTQV